MTFGMYTTSYNPYLMSGAMMNPMMMGGIYNPTMQISYMNQMDQYGIDRQVNLYTGQNNAQFKMSAQTSDIARQVRILQQEVKADHQDNIKAEYNKLLAAVKSTYGSQLPSSMNAEEKEAQIRAYAEQVYAQQTGAYITDEIRANSSGSFMSGLKQVITFGLGSSTTADENIAMINGTKQTKGSKAAKIAGNVVGGLLGGLLAVGSYFLFKGKKAA